MAGHKSPRAKDNKTKKRKREANDADVKPKRHRQQGRHEQASGHADDAPMANKLIEADSLLDVAVNVCQDVVGGPGSRDAGWRISKPMGGRMLDIDPILTSDDRHLILAYNTSIQVFTTADSLLVRRIPISTLDASAPRGSTPATIVATRLSIHDPNLIWVACSDGQIYRVNWTRGTEAPTTFRTASGTASAMSIVPAQGRDGRDIVLAVECDKDGCMEVVAYKGTTASATKSKSLLVLEKHGAGLQLLEASADGRLLLGAFDDRLFLGVASKSEVKTLEELEYDFYSFVTPDLITCLDMRIHREPVNRKPEAGSDMAVDLIVGGARGAIYIYNDAIARFRAAGKSQHAKDGIQVQKFHWHRRAVHSVKWSRDGNYFISGGSEQVLVLWQVDTGKKDLLPHLSGIVENVVVSASGSSYVVHLDDNSCMILSTAEMKPTTYVSGIQSASAELATPKDLLVKRTWSMAAQVRRPIPAAIKPSDPSRLHVCVGNGRQATMAGEPSAPLLQTFDLESFTSVKNQALARTLIPAHTMTSKGHTIDEPLVSHIAFSSDSKWLASVDEWKPAARDVESITSGEAREQFIRERREIYLKFWEVDDTDNSVALVSRINAPHGGAFPEAVLGLAAHPTSTSFATLGGDGVVRVWRPRPRQQSGLAIAGGGGDDTVTWSCSLVISVGDQVGREAGTELSGGASLAKPQGSIAFSEDGSTLFAAFGVGDVGIVYVIDAATGQVAKTLEGLWDGQLQSIRALSSFVVVLSKDLRVYDVVGDELRYGIKIPKGAGVKELLQLAVDHTSGHFAVTLPIGGISCIGVFDPEDPEPLLVQSTPHRIVSLVSAPTTSGFIALDDAAQIWVVAEGSDPAALATAQPLQDLRLDEGAAEDKNGGGEVMAAAEDEDLASDEDMDDWQDGADDDVDMDDAEFHPRVIPQQHLAEIFDAAPAFAAPSVEDMFYKVTALLATRPLPQGSA